VIIGRSGYVTLDALRWLHDTGAAFVHVDSSGELIAASVAPGVDLAGLRRAQALAADGPAGVEIASSILAAKVEGQLAVVDELQVGAESREAVQSALSEIGHAADLDALLAAEAQAAAAYWQAWAALPARFPPREAARLPDHWLTFGRRASLITAGPRTATNPANAILNYLYALLEAETILACYAVGLDPGLGIFHTDRRDRASLALDLMEACRPAVDAYVLALLTQRRLSAREFVETREGACRITPRLAGQLASTGEVWRSHVASVVEQAAHVLAKHARSRVPSRTPLTGAHHRAAWNQRAPDRRQRQSRADFAKLPSTCRDCGAPLPDRRRRYCDSAATAASPSRRQPHSSEPVRFLPGCAQSSKTRRTAAGPQSSGVLRTPRTKRRYASGRVSGRTRRSSAPRFCPACGTPGSPSWSPRRAYPSTTARSSGSGRRSRTRGIGNRYARSASRRPGRPRGRNRGLSPPARAVGSNHGLVVS
jgi:CRISPR-associated endonuclease Cas1